MADAASFFAHESSYIDAGAHIGNQTRIWHFCHISEHARIGERCSLGQNVFVAPRAQLGAGCKVQNNVSIYEGVICEEDVFLGPSMVFTNINRPRAHISRRHAYETTYVERGVSIGAHATIVCGIRLGKYCFIAAGAVVRTDVAPYALMAGVPAQQVGWVSQAGARLYFDDHGMASCPWDQSRYRLLAEGSVVPEETPT